MLAAHHALPPPLGGPGDGGVDGADDTQLADQLRAAAASHTQASSAWRASQRSLALAHLQASAGPSEPPLQTAPPPRRAPPPPSPPAAGTEAGGAAVATEGWLLKKGLGSSVLGRRNWKERYFALQGVPPRLRYYKEEPPTSAEGPRRAGWAARPLGEVCLAQCVPSRGGHGVVVPDAHKYNDFYFQLGEASGRDWHFRAADAAERDRWVAAIEAAVDAIEAGATAAPAERGGSDTGGGAGGFATPPAVDDAVGTTKELDAG
eukprot:g6581.t1